MKKKKAKVKKAVWLPFEDHYSGENSRLFWDAVNSSKKQQGELYSLGVALQNLESQVLNTLNDEILNRK